MTADRRLRISHVTVQAVLVWDDGEELSPGPELRPFSVPVSAALGAIAALPAEVDTLATQLTEQHEASTSRS